MSAIGQTTGGDWSPPWNCDLCMSVAFAADPCPFHDQHTWDEWITQALKEWAWTIQRDMRRRYPAPYALR